MLVTKLFTDSRQQAWSTGSAGISSYSSWTSTMLWVICWAYFYYTSYHSRSWREEVV